MEWIAWDDVWACIPVWALYYKDDDQLMEEYDNEVLDSYNAEEDYWVGARYARGEGD